MSSGYLLFDLNVVSLLYINSFGLNFSIGNPEWEAEPFDFLIDGEFVRMSLEQFLLAKGISAVRI